MAKPKTKYAQKFVSISVVGETLEFKPDTVTIHRDQDVVHWRLVDEGKIIWIHSKEGHPKPFRKDHTYTADGKEAVSDIVVDKKHEGLHPYCAKVKTFKGTITSDPNVDVMPPSVGPHLRTTSKVKP